MHQPSLTKTLIWRSIIKQTWRWRRVSELDRRLNTTLITIIVNDAAVLGISKRNCNVQKSGERKNAFGHVTFNQSENVMQLCVSHEVDDHDPDTLRTVQSCRKPSPVDLTGGVYRKVWHQEKMQSTVLTAVFQCEHTHTHTHTLIPHSVSWCTMMSWHICDLICPNCGTSGHQDWKKQWRRARGGENQTYCILCCPVALCVWLPSSGVNHLVSKLR